MSLISEMLEQNQSFVKQKAYEPFRTDPFPNKKLAVLTCMDTRLVELLPKAMSFGNGDVKLIKNAGAIVTHPFGSVMRSLLVAVYELGAEEIAVVGHHGCGMTGLSCSRVLDTAKRRGISQDVIDALANSGVDLQRWLCGFDRVEDGVRQSVATIVNHPLLPRDVPVHGMLICPDTGRLDLLVDGYAVARA